MHINPSEIKSIKTIGNLHDEDVKLVATKGGLYLALGKKLKDKKGHEPLAAASHPALVIHQIEKQFKKEFQPAMHKSETEQLHEVTELACDIKGLSMFSLKKNNELDVVIAKFGIEICKCECEINGNSLKIKKIDYRAGFEPSMKDTLRSQMNNGVAEVAKSQGIDIFTK